MSSPRFARNALLMIATVAITLASAGCPKPRVPPTWTRVFGGPRADYAHSVIATRDGGYLVAGSTWSFAAGEDDMYLIKLSASGAEEWSNTYGGASRESASSVAEAAGGGFFLAGRTTPPGSDNTDLCLVKTSTSGAEAWTKNFGGTGNDGARCVIATADGGCLVVGWTQSFGGEEQDMYVVKTDASGAERWSRTFGGAGVETAYSVTAAPDGGYLVAGLTNSSGAGDYDMYLVKLDAVGGEVWSTTFGGDQKDGATSVIATSDGGYLVSGYTYSFGAGGEDMYLVKTDASGVEQWSRTFGGSADDFASEVVATNDGGYLVAGGAEPLGAAWSAMYVVKTDGSGTGQWSNTFGGDDYDAAGGAAMASDGGCVLVGTTHSYGVGGAEFYVVKIDAEGNGSSAPTP